MMNHKAAIYARVSTEEQTADSQETICREYCARAGLEVYKVYRDDGVSGMKTSRPAFDEMLRDMRAYRFNCIVVVRMDRIGRSLSHLLQLIDEFNRKGVEFCTADGKIDTVSASGKFFLQVMGAFNEYERNVNSERTREALRSKTNVGKRGPDKTPRKRRGTLRKAIE